MLMHGSDFGQLLIKFGNDDDSTNSEIFDFNAEMTKKREKNQQTN